MSNTPGTGKEQDTLANLAEGDVILKLDGTPVPSKGALQRLVWSRPPGSSVQVEIWRNGAAYTVTCVLSAR